MAYVNKALFVYSEEGEIYRDDVIANPHGCIVVPYALEAFSRSPEELLKQASHVVVAAGIDGIKEIIPHVMNVGGSIGFIPLDEQKALSRCYLLPDKREEAVSLALKDDPEKLDLVFCNDTIMLFKGTIGRLPLFDSSQNASKFSVILDGLKKMRSLHLLPFTFQTKGKNTTEIETAASGCLILETPEASFASRMIGDDCSFHDGMVSTVIFAPFSIIDYLKLMWRRIGLDNDTKWIPPSIGYIKSPELTIQSSKPLAVTIDGKECTTTPARFHVVKGGLRVNLGNEEDEQNNSVGTEEKYSINNLPAGKELQNAQNKHVPFFTYASEERFRDLFVALRDDARLDSTYVVLMILSTILATVGLYLNSASVIIGAMLLAPLMAPIISLAMGLLRYERKMFRQSLYKIAVGIVLALSTSVLFTLLSPYQPVTAEMQGRLNPTVLDLIVAIAAGVAGAYTKSFKEILQSLAGVAIAVALVPPLAVAGIGLGRFDPSFFGHAFLLFLTNFIGIILAATFTFRMLGYSPVVRDKKSIFLVTVFFVLLTIPLSMAFNGIIERTTFEKKWQHERFLVNGKYLIVSDATLQHFGESDVLVVEMQAREQLTRSDLKEFRSKVNQNYQDDIAIRVKVTYIP